jgi:hypothetical protein
MERNIVEIKTKAGIISDFTYSNIANAKYKDFFDYHDLGIPLAISFYSDLCILAPQGIAVLNETYESLCELCDIDPNDEFETIDEFFDEAS